MPPEASPLAWGLTALAGAALVAVVMWGHDPADAALATALPWRWGPAWGMAGASFAAGVAYGWSARPGWLAPAIVLVLGGAVLVSGVDAHHEPSPDGDLVPLAIAALHVLMAMGAALGAAVHRARSDRGPRPAGRRRRPSELVAQQRHDAAEGGTASAALRPRRLRRRGGRPRRLSSPLAALGAQSL